MHPYILSGKLKDYIIAYLEWTAYFDNQRVFIPTTDSIISFYQVYDNLIQISSLIFNSIPTKFNHLFRFLNLKPISVKYHISLRDIATKHNPTILHLKSNLSNLRYHSGSLANKKPKIQFSSLIKLDIFNPIRPKFHNLLRFSSLEPRWFQYHILL